MPNFANPFQGNINRKITKEELVQAIRLNIAGELMALLRILDPEEAEHFASGEEEVKEMMEKLGIK